MSEIIVILFAFFLFTLTLFGMDHMYGVHECSQHQVITGQETKKVVFGSCYVKHDDRWMRWDEYKAVITASQLSK